MEILQQLHIAPFVVDVFRLSIWLLVIMVIFVPLERFCPLHPQKFFRKAFFTDFIYFFLSGLLPKFFIALPMSLIALGLHGFIPGELHQQVASLPMWARFSAAMVVGEFGTYWGHRWMHEIPFLWRFHAIHHSAEQIDWLVNTRAHPIDLAFPRLCGFVPMYLLGLAQASGNSMDLMPLLVTLVGTIWGFFIHANLRWRFGCLEWMISTPAFHHWHHTNDGPEFINKNYAPMLPWMDKLFGTFYLPKKQWPTRYGINDTMSPSIVQQLIQPFSSSKKLPTRNTGF
ncbi:MAG: sterol desaturase family protein [Methylovulum sp.]|uniref:sterol desaturase family protein n=1 Tax=Methylovulum sp. TaxID=1916980 RepID=UPI0026314075|nr:sterol desaturase family protein [Methylovulum sp.]MDD2722787.1 sterol desaturase family protein [Methylovulum sp.]MDD5124921.1 sterol desaturase family protein [Methylovulum sp.]